MAPINQNDPQMRALMGAAQTNGEIAKLILKSATSGAKTITKEDLNRALASIPQRKAPIPVQQMPQQFGGEGLAVPPPPQVLQQRGAPGMSGAERMFQQDQMPRGIVQDRSGAMRPPQMPQQSLPEIIEGGLRKVDNFLFNSQERKENETLAIMMARNLSPEGAFTSEDFRRAKNEIEAQRKMGLTTRDIQNNLIWQPTQSQPNTPWISGQPEGRTYYNQDEWKQAMDAHTRHLAAFMRGETDVAPGAMPILYRPPMNITEPVRYVPPTEPTQFTPMGPTTAPQQGYGRQTQAPQRQAAVERLKQFAAQNPDFYADLMDAGINLQ